MLFSVNRPNANQLESWSLVPIIGNLWISLEFLNKSKVIYTDLYSPARSLVEFRLGKPANMTQSKYQVTRARLIISIIVYWYIGIFQKIGIGMGMLFIFENRYR